MKSILALTLLLASCAAGSSPATSAGSRPARVFLRCTPEAEGVLVNDGVWAVGVP